MPLIDKELLPWFRLAHGLYNTIVILLFFRQAWLGIAIRRARMAKAPLPVGAARSHRKMGPILTILGIAGFCAGLVVVTLGEREYLEHWHHLAVGTVIALLIAYTYALSRKIKGPDAPERILHFRIGVVILCLYFFEAFLGIGILL